MEEAKRKQIEAEMARLEREAEEREKQRRMEEHREIQRKAARERLEQLKSTALGARAFEGIDEEVRGCDMRSSVILVGDRKWPSVLLNCCCIVSFLVLLMWEKFRLHVDK